MRPNIRPFIGFIRKQSGPDFGVWFPDLPDCQPTGDTIAEARQNAERELALHCRHLQDAGTPVPSPSYMHELSWTRDLRDGLVVLISPPTAA
jgi:predicted RNase H-like HicB family nuclease